MKKNELKILMKLNHEYKVIQLFLDQQDETIKLMKSYGKKQVFKDAFAVNNTAINRRITDALLDVQKFTDPNDLKRNEDILTHLSSANFDINEKFMLSLVVQTDEVKTGRSIYPGIVDGPSNDTASKPIQYAGDTEN